MKINIGQTLAQAGAWVGGHIGGIAAITGLFYVLPYIVLMLVMGGVSPMLNPNPAAFQAILAQAGPLLVVGYFVSIYLQLSGMSAISALYVDRPRGVGEAIGVGFASGLSLLGATLLYLIGLIVVILILSVGIAAMISNLGFAASFIGALAMFALFAYITIKFSLTMPVIVHDGVRNPITALVRSWRLSRGNSFRLFAIFLIMAIAYYALVIAVMQLAFRPLLNGDPTSFAPGLTPAMIALTVGMGIVGAAFAAYLVGVITSAYDQLVGPQTETLADAFA